MDRETVGGILPSLPYKCGDPTCECQESPTLSEREQTVHLYEREDSFEALVRDEDGRAFDILRDHNWSSLIEAVHRNYPHAKGGSK